MPSERKDKRKRIAKEAKKSKKTSGGIRAKDKETLVRLALSTLGLVICTLFFFKPELVPEWLDSLLDTFVGSKHPTSPPP